MYFKTITQKALVIITRWIICQFYKTQKLKTVTELVIITRCIICQFYKTQKLKTVIEFSKQNFKQHV